MKISSKSWKSYIERLSRIDQKAAKSFADWFRENPDAEIDDLLNYAYYTSDYYGNAASELACEMYDEVAVASGKTLPPAEPARTATYGEVAKAIQGKLLTTQDPDAVGSIVGTKVKTVGLDTLLKNSLRDGAEFAWIPSGDTCAFCIMLASNGWQKASKKALKKGHAEHVHNNCNCTYAIRFDENTEVEGYDPEYYKGLYDSADGKKWKDKINSMRRDMYAKDPEKYLAPKRASYALKATGGRILDLYGEYENNWAENYYEEIRHKSTDCKKIAERLKLKESDIVAIKNYLFYDKSWYNDLTGEFERFAPDPAIGQSWQRLAEGKTILPHDRTLINHELYEMQIKHDNHGISHSDAHTMATLRYNYQGEAEEYYADLRKRSKKG